MQKKIAMLSLMFEKSSYAMSVLAVILGSSAAIAAGLLLGIVPLHALAFAAF